MITTDVAARISGCQVSWDTSPVNADSIHAGLANVKLEQYAPSRHTQEAALKKAVRDYGKAIQAFLPKTDGANHSFVVEPKFCRQTDGFELKDNGQHSSGTQNTNRMVITARVVDDRVEICEYGARWYDFAVRKMEFADNAQENYEHYRSQASGAEVGRSLVNIIKHLHGTCTRQAGGLYYLPEGTVDTWDEAAEVYERHGVTVNRVRFVMDVKSAKMVRKAIVAELVEESANVLEDLLRNNIKEETVQRRLQRAKELRGKCGIYEQLLQELLPEVRAIDQQILKCEAAAQAIVDDDKVFEDCFA